MIIWLNRMGFAAAVAMFLSLLGTSQVLACACCSNLGQRAEGVATFSEDRPNRSILSSLRFQNEVSLYQSEADFEITAPGIVPGNYGVYELDPLPLDGTLPKEYSFVLTDKQSGQKGSITVPIPAEYEYFVVDPRTERIDPGTGPAIYRELRFNSKARLTGIFAHGGDQADVRFVIQGLGGGCADAMSYNAFTLIVGGEKTGFTLLGWLNN